MKVNEVFQLNLPSFAQVIQLKKLNALVIKETKLFQAFLVCCGRPEVCMSLKRVQLLLQGDEPARGEVDIFEEDPSAIFGCRVDGFVGLSKAFL